MDESMTDVNVDDEMVEIYADVFPFDPSIKRQKQFTNLMNRGEEERTKFLTKMRVIS